MTHANRVDPYGHLAAVEARGTMMGNRGILHTDDAVIVRRQALRAWLCCVLQFKGRHREVLAPRSYTELFFLDEATALAAGHRPCFECRHRDAVAFAHAFGAGQGHRGPDRPLADAIDKVLAGERRLEARPTVTVADLPRGAMVEHESVPHLVTGGTLVPWSYDGYGRPVSAPRTAALLTPPATVAAMVAGYRPLVHPSGQRVDARHQPQQSVRMPSALRVGGPGRAHPTAASSGSAEA